MGEKVAAGEGCFMIENNGDKKAMLSEDEKDRLPVCEERLKAREFDVQEVEEEVEEHDFVLAPLLDDGSSK
jgi:hypothetical protein